MTYHRDMFDIELEDLSGAQLVGPPFEGLVLPFRPCVGDVIMFQDKDTPAVEVLKVTYFNGQTIRTGELCGTCEFVGFLLTVRKLSP